MNRTAPIRLVRGRTLARLARAFTLIEMLIAVGAVALIAVGLGKLFASTGQTVKVGKRISYLNDLAATLERQIRSDLSNVTRDGFLVIRHINISSDPSNILAGVPLSKDDLNPNPRARRADQILFFVNGHFTSAREPQWPGRAPAGSAARIVIGHGMRMEEYADYANITLASDPAWANPNGGWPAGLGRAGPNQYASDWILLRHVTTLVRPSVTLSTVPATTSGLTVPTYLRNNWGDSATQNSLQPAVASIFRFDPAHLNAPDIRGGGYGTPMLVNGQLVISPLNFPIAAPTQIARQGDQQPPDWPNFAGGLVDVASIDLVGIRARVLSTPDLLQKPDPNPANPGENDSTVPPRFHITPVSELYNRALDKDPAHAMKMLMASAFPGSDPWIFSPTGHALAGPLASEAASTGQPEQRMLCAATPPDFTGNLAGNGTPYPIDQPWRVQDQAMFTASNLAVGCSEFVVEWSFGDVYPVMDGSSVADPQQHTGQIIWHGLPRTNSGDAIAPAPYRNSTAHNATGGWADPTLHVGYDSQTNRVPMANGATLLWPVYSALIHWPADISDYRHDEMPLYSFFGYLDPTYDPSVYQAAGEDVLPKTIDWPWPRLLRFTISLTDPADRTVEQTYQFIVDISGGAGQAQ